LTSAKTSTKNEPSNHPSPLSPTPKPKASLRLEDGSSADEIVRSGNISRGYDGVLRFPALQVFAPPGTYLVAFAPLDPNNRVLQPARLRLRLRNCTVGEADARLTKTDALLRKVHVEFKCDVCQWGSYRCGWARRAGCAVVGLSDGQGRPGCLNPWSQMNGHLLSLSP